MQDLNYSVIGILAIFVHLIINHDMFKTIKSQDFFAGAFFHRYSLSVLFYYVTDTMWGIISYTGNTKILYIDTFFYYVAMGLSVVLCCQYIISFINLHKLFARFLSGFGILFCVIEFSALIVNVFHPIFFYFDSDGNYHAGPYRHIALIVQIIMFAMITLVSAFVVFKKENRFSKRNLSICLFSIAMTLSIIGQTYFPLLPLYSIGLMIGGCILHVFIQEDIKTEQLVTLGTLARIFYSVHVINLEDDTADEYNAQNEVKKIANRRNGASKMMVQTITAVTDEEYLEAALEFTSLDTISERMKNRTFISNEFVGKRVGWYLASFLVMERDKDGKITKIIFTTNVIDKEKKEKEKLVKKTRTDELTGLLNRRAYEDDIYEQNALADENGFIYVSLDINGLKIVNDTIGHAAGDELIVGGCSCMKNALSPYGNLYRIGGDEFVAILFCGVEKLNGIMTKFDKEIASWKGTQIENLSISYGCVAKEEVPGASLPELAALADKRMYEAKSIHYRKAGFDRRGQQDAHKALCNLYTKILRINLTEDSYQIVNMDVSEQTEEKGFSDKISMWLKSFGTSGHVHPEDLDEYLKHTDIDFMSRYFAGNKTSLQIFYRRKYETGFKQVMMELIPANDYSPENQSLFLYVKDIDR